MSLIQQFEDICTAVRNEMDMDFFKFWDDINKVSEDLGSNFCCLLWPLPKQTNGFLSGLSDFIYFVIDLDDLVPVCYAEDSLCGFLMTFRHTRFLLISGLLYKNDFTPCIMFSFLE